MDKNQDPKKPSQYADSSISDKAFKRAIFLFFMFCALFLIGLLLVVNADGINMG